MHHGETAVGPAKLQRIGAAVSRHRLLVIGRERLAMGTLSARSRPTCWASPSAANCSAVVPAVASSAALVERSTRTDAPAMAGSGTLNQERFWASGGVALCASSSNDGGGGTLRSTRSARPTANPLKLSQTSTARIAAAMWA